MTLLDAVEGKEYIISSIETGDEELDAFLFSLGCYSGEVITVVTRLKSSCIVSIKDARYNIDKQLASVIYIWITETDYNIVLLSFIAWLAKANHISRGGRKWE